MSDISSTPPDCDPVVVVTDEPDTADIDGIGAGAVHPRSSGTLPQATADTSNATPQADTNPSPAEPLPWYSKQRFFLAVYLSYLFPRDMIYQWEWNPYNYFRKWVGRETGHNFSRHKGNYPIPLYATCFCWLGAFLGIAIPAILDQYVFAVRDTPLLIGSFGATAVLLYGAQQSPLAQPKNVLLGHTLAALIGVTCYTAMGKQWYSAALAVSLTIVAMLLFTCVHPPGGATALIAVLGPEPIHRAGYLYVATVLFGMTLMVGVACVVNNIPKAPHTRYPRYWF
eukprot:TRINITY_DN6240_c0_g1_i1.p1 TRINITY_DN6240_c0_g1~~TRINITY_DN6240_c0_g1_i1.p1  ORF type:complete len:283 (-),score=26.08 TRINITY_DN6240_c0_g1_i1:78-926(-)